MYGNLKPMTEFCRIVGLLCELMAKRFTNSRKNITSKNQTMKWVKCSSFKTITVNSATEIFIFSGLNLMNYVAVKVMREFNEIVIAFGQSDEYSFVFHKSAEVYNRRASKILTCMNSLFTSSYVFYWSEFVPNQPLLYPPSFDARIVLYPSDENLRDYLSWRQADTHINNLYNTVFWKLVLDGGRSNTQAQEDLSGTFSADKNEILFSRFGINYNNLPPMYRKGTILMKKNVTVPELKNKHYPIIVPFFTDIIQDRFWDEHTEVMTRGQPQPFNLDDELSRNILIEKQISVLLKRKS